MCNNFLQSVLHWRDLIIHNLLVTAEQFPIAENMLEETLMATFLTLLPTVDDIPPDIFDRVQVAWFARPGKENNVTLLSKPCSDNPRIMDGTVILKEIL